MVTSAHQIRALDSTLREAHLPPQERLAAHNELSAALREERHGLVQRELLLDTMLQNTPVAMLLSDTRRRIVYANIAARKLLSDGRRIEGQSLEVLLIALEDGAPVWLKPEHADSLRIGLPATARPGTS